MADRIPPSLKGKKLVFDQFHPLMHRIGTKECRSYYGGVRQHAKLHWDLMVRPRWRHRYYRLFLCPLGKHDEERWFSGAPIRVTGAQQTMVVCGACGFKIEEWRAISPEEHDQGEIR